MRAAITWTVAALAAIAAPCSASAAVEAAPGAPALALRGCAVEKVEAKATTLAFTADITNPTADVLLVGGVSYAIDVEGKRIFEGTVPGGIEIAPGGSAALPLPGELRYGDLPGIAGKIALKKPVPYKLIVAAAVRTPAGDATLPLTHEGDLAIPKLPGFGLAGLRIKSMNPFDAAVEVKIALENENTFALPAGLLEYRITVAGGEIASARAALPALAAGKKTEVAIPVKLSVKKVGKGVVSALKGDAAMVGLHAVASLAGLSYPVDLEAKLPTKKGK